MLSYQHIYHAGNMADVHKHASLSVLLTHMAQKNKPLTYIETHAGRGIYDLESDESLKTQEAQKGFLAFVQKEQLKDHPYFKLQKRLREEIGRNIYAGSPFIAEALLRQTDSIHLMELHPQEYQGLYRLMRYPNTHLHHRDGYEGGIAICPPQPRRGILVMDPSYEMETEYCAAAKFLTRLNKRWAEGVLFLWYPVLKEERHKPMLDKLKAAGLPKIYRSEVMFKKVKEGMLGSGLIIINTPFGVEKELNAVKEWF